METSSTNNIPANDSPRPARTWVSPLSHFPKWLSNKYFIALTCFAVVMLFLDKNDVFTQRSRHQEDQALKQSKVYYTKEINKLKDKNEGLSHDLKSIEKQAREKYLMKKDNEDIYIVTEKPDQANN